VSTAGDVNNDGYDDVIVGANSYDNGETEGAAWIYLGSASGLNPGAVWMAEGNQADAECRAIAYILVTIEDWDAGPFRLEHEPSGRRIAGLGLEVDSEIQQLGQIGIGPVNGIEEIGKNPIDLAPKTYLTGDQEQL